MDITNSQLAMAFLLSGVAVILSGIASGLISKYIDEPFGGVVAMCVGFMIVGGLVYA